MEHETGTGRTQSDSATGEFGAWGRWLSRARAAVTVLVVLGVGVGAVHVWWTWEVDDPRQQASPASAPSAPASSAPEPEPVGATPSPERSDGSGPEAAAIEVMRVWDAAREDAWQRGDDTLLAALYVGGSSAGDADRDAMRRWTNAGWRVTGVAPRMIAVVEVSRGEDRLVVDVTDQFGGAVAVSVEGEREVRLPGGQPQERRMVLRWSESADGGEAAPAGGWRVQKVSEPVAVPRPRSQ